MFRSVFSIDGKGAETSRDTADDMSESEEGR